MIETLVGKNQFALDEALKNRVDSFILAHNALGLERFDAIETQAATLIDSLLSLPFLLTKKLIIIRAPSANKEFSDRLPTIIDRVTDAVDVIFVDPQIDKRTQFYTFLKKHTKLHDFSELEPGLLGSWVQKRASSYSFSITPSVARFLIDRVGTNQQLLDQEIKKLGLYDTAITQETVRILTEETPQSKIFDLTDAFLSSTSEKTMKLYRNQRAQRVDPVYILNMITWQLHAIALAVHANPQTENTLVSAGMSPYTARKVLVLAQRITKQNIKYVVKDAVQTDLLIKTGADADHALELFLLKRTIS